MKPFFRPASGCQGGGRRRRSRESTTTAGNTGDPVSLLCAHYPGCWQFQSRRLVLLLVTLTVLPATIYADDRERQCRNVIDTDWSATEAWAWTQICMGYRAHLDELDNKYFNPRHHDQLPKLENRKISSSFLMTILSNKRFRNLITRHGVTITDAHFTDDIDLQNGYIPWPLTLSNSLFAGTVNMRYLHSDRRVQFRSSRFLKPLLLDSSVIDGDLSIDEVYGDSITMDSASITRNLSLNNSTFNRYTILRDIYVGGRLDMSHFRSAYIRMVSATIDGDFIITKFVTPSVDEADHEEERRVLVDFDGMSYRRQRYATAEAFTGFLRLLDEGSLRFSYQPYSQLASALKRDGAINLASDVVFMGKTKELSNSRGWTKLTLGFLKISVGFGVGYYAFFAIFWAGLIVLLGCGFMHFCGELKDGRVQRIDGYGIWFSIDYLIPVVQLNKAHFENFNMLITNPVARVYFYCQQLLGYVLSVVLLATITRVMLT